MHLHTGARHLADVRVTVQGQSAILASSRPPRTAHRAPARLCTRTTCLSVSRGPTFGLKLSRSGAFLGRAAHRYRRCHAQNTEYRTSDARVRNSRASQDRNMKPAATQHAGLDGATARGARNSVWTRYLLLTTVRRCVQTRQVAEQTARSP